MFRIGLYFCMILIISGICMAEDYTLFTRATGASATAVSKVELTTAAASTNGETLTLTFKWTYGSAPTPANNNDKALTICCVSALKVSTDPLASFLKDKCFGVNLNGPATAAALTTANNKIVFAQGVKSGTNFHVGSYFNPAGTAGDAGTVATAVVTSSAFGLNPGELASIGFLNTAPTTMTFSCGHADFAATAQDVTVASVVIPATNTATFDLVGSGTSTCTTSTTKSSASFLGFAPLALFASILTSLALF